MTPGQQINLEARAAGMGVQSVPAKGHALTAYLAPGAIEGSRWHVYLEGDGRPWWQGRVPSADPSALQGRASVLMQLDHAPRLLLHRPCYARDRMPPGCGPDLWTDARYGAEVIAAMDEALDVLAADFRIDEIVLIGFSGGGTLARLLASRRTDVVALVTVAANLDHDLWSRMHGYRPLSGSLQITDVPPLGPKPVQWHLVGAADDVVPPRVVRSGAAHDPHAQVQEILGFDHHCCWTEIWPEVLRALGHRLSAAPRVAH